VKEWRGRKLWQKHSIKHERTIKTTLYANYQALITKPGDELQTAAHRLNNTAKKYNLKISTSNTKSMRMCDNEIRRPKNGDTRNITE
jgi:hypothetical protein